MTFATQAAHSSLLSHVCQKDVCPAHSGGWFGERQVSSADTTHHDARGRLPDFQNSTRFMTIISIQDSRCAAKTYSSPSEIDSHRFSNCVIQYNTTVRNAIGQSWPFPSDIWVGHFHNTFCIHWKNWLQLTA